MKLDIYEFFLMPGKGKKKEFWCWKSLINDFIEQYGH